MRGAVYVNGTISPADQAVVPVYDHGFVYGEGVYETLRTYNRVPFLYDRHVKRLRSSARHLNLPVPFDDGTLLGWIQQTMEAAAMQEAYRRGGEEALMCNYCGELSECAQSNLFIVRRGVAVTPKSKSGLLEGVTRAFIFEVGKDVGVDVRDEILYPKDLETADEVF